MLLKAISEGLTKTCTQKIERNAATKQSDMTMRIFSLLEKIS